MDMLSTASPVQSGTSSCTPSCLLCQASEMLRRHVSAHARPRPGLANSRTGSFRQMSSRTRRLLLPGGRCLLRRGSCSRALPQYVLAKDRAAPANELCGCPMLRQRRPRRTGQVQRAHPRAFLKTFDTIRSEHQQRPPKRGPADGMARDPAILFAASGPRPRCLAARVCSSLYKKWLYSKYYKIIVSF